MDEAFTAALVLCSPTLAAVMIAFAGSATRCFLVRRGSPRVTRRVRMLEEASRATNDPRRTTALLRARHRELLGWADALPTLALLSFGFAMFVGFGCFLRPWPAAGASADGGVDRAFAEALHDSFVVVLVGLAIATLALVLRSVAGALVVRTSPACRAIESNAWAHAARSPRLRIARLFGVVPCVWAVATIAARFEAIFEPPRVDLHRVEVVDVLTPTSCEIHLGRNPDGSTRPEFPFPARAVPGSAVVLLSQDGVATRAVLRTLENLESRGIRAIAMRPSTPAP